MSTDHLRIVVGVPSGGHWTAPFGLSLATMVGHFMSNPVKGYRSQELRTVNVRGSILPKSRNNLVRAAIACHADYLLFVDTDHTFPPNLVHRLLAHHKKVVALNCPTKVIPAGTTARLKSDKYPEGIPVYSDPGMPLEKVWRVGTGIMLLHKSVFEQLPAQVWDIKWLEDKDTFQGEDWTLCEWLEGKDVPIYVDHDLSVLCAHVGAYEYTHDVVGELVCSEQES